MIRIDPNENVAALIERWPESARLFIDFHMNCVGCDMSKFETLQGACAIYHVDVDRFVERLKALSQRNSQSGEEEK